MIVFILALFNLGGWFMWQLSLQRLDERLDRRLLEVGSLVKVDLDALDWESSGTTNPIPPAAVAQLNRSATAASLDRIFVFDREGIVWYDSSGLLEPGQREWLLEGDQRQLDRVWQGIGATTPFYPVGDGHEKRAYVPIEPEATEQIQLALGLSAASGDFADLKRFSRALWISTLASVSVALIAVLLLIQVVRRAVRMEETISRTERAIAAGQLTSSLAHELRNPLGIIQTNAEVLSERGDSTQRECARDILCEVQRLSQLIERFLNLSSQRPEQWTLCSAGEIVRRIVQRHQPALQKAGIETMVDMPENIDDRISAQEDRLESALSNLIENAQHALAGASSAKLEIAVSEDRRRIVVEIRDNGPGFSNESLQMAFQPFYTARDKGTGLGLAIVRTIMADHQGSIDIRNRRQGGALVRLIFPKNRKKRA